MSPVSDSLNHVRHPPVSPPSRHLLTTPPLLLQDRPPTSTDFPQSFRKNIFQY